MSLARQPLNQRLRFLIQPNTQRHKTSLVIHKCTRDRLYNSTYVSVEFKSLVQARSRTLNNVGAASDKLLKRMQAAEAKRGMIAAFHASPNELGRLAVKSARKVR